MSSDIKEDWVPEWAKKTVWYQIFPERFWNGDRSNDPRKRDIEGAFPLTGTNEWKIHPWTSDWYEFQDYERKNEGELWHHLVRRRYGGDLQGILDRLGYLEDLGITGIYFNPVFDSPSHHKYDGICYHHIDPTFGPDPDGDRELMRKEVWENPTTWIWTAADELMLKLIREMHRRGMKVIFDGVFNHIGSQSRIFQDVVKLQRRSKYRDWFVVRSWDDEEAGTKFEYQGWWNVKELPEWRQDENGTASGPKEYIFESTKKWMMPRGRVEDGIDGWRLDVAFCIKHPFWKDWRKWVKNLKPDAYLTAEIVDDPLEVIGEYLKGDEFDAVMNYQWAFICSDFFFEEGIDAREFDKRLEGLRNAFPECVGYVMQNLFNSHDSHRIGSHVVNRKRIHYGAWQECHQKTKGWAEGYETRKPGDEEWDLVKMFVIFQMTYIGAPMVYYGEEAGMWGANDPCCRKPMVWPELKYDDEIFRVDGTKRETGDKVEFNGDLYEHYRKLIGIRNDHKALQLGDFKTLVAEGNIYAFVRKHENEVVVVVVNRGEHPEPVKLELGILGEFQDVLNGGELFMTMGNGYLDLEVERKWGRILVKGA